VFGCSKSDSGRDSGSSSGGIPEDGGAGDDGSGGGDGGGGDDGGSGDGGGGDDGGDDGDDGGDGGGPKFDIGEVPDSGGGDGDECPGGGGGGGGDVEFSNIWIANSSQGTVSKIDTFTGQELGRYTSGPEATTEPSRTSVNLYGDAAVSNRGSMSGGNGSISKIAARIDDCPDTNGNGVKDTSDGPGNVLPWGQDECVLWNTTIPSDMYQHGPRPTAWEGSILPNGCADPNPRLWIGWYDYAANTGKFHRLDGTNGQILDSVDVPNWTGLNYGPYGGAVDGNGDFWASGWQQGHLVRIDGDTLAVDVYPFPQPPTGMQWSYGMALDQYGNPWIASSGAVATFDAASEQWSWVVLDHLSVRGVMVDRADRAWFAIDGAGAQGMNGCGLAVIDVAAKSVIAPLLSLSGCMVPVGISIDVEGYVWVVDQSANQAFKVHPDTYQIALTATGLTGPYTYSDMTGAGLDLVTNPPG
jgi:hypothetical protein